MSEIKQKWRPEAGLVDLIAEDGATVALPIGMLSGLNMMAWRVLSGHANAKHGALGKGWATMTTLPVLKSATGTMDLEEGPRAILSLDPTTEVAIHFHMTVETAREVAQGLLQCADKIDAEAAAMGKGH
jgi:hypothetical protein